MVVCSLCQYVVHRERVLQLKVVRLALEKMRDIVNSKNEKGTSRQAYVGIANLIVHQ